MFLKIKNYKPKTKSWFSVIIAMLITAFLVILSSWILSLIVQESKNTRITFNTISTYAAAEWALEYAMLKLKNHQEWFQDKVVYNDDFDSKLLASDPNNIIFQKDQIIEYEINNYAKSYTWSIWVWNFEIIPLFFDSWSSMQINSKNPNKGISNVLKTSFFKIENLNGDITWNIIWNDTNWSTFWIVWTWWTSTSFGSWYSVDNYLWAMKKVDDSTSEIKIDFNTWSDIWKFLQDYENNYLIMYNSSSSPVTYHIESNKGFSLPNTTIIASSTIWDFKQNIEFSESKSKLFDMLKYSLFSE